MFRNVLKILFFVVISFSAFSQAAENPDELYRKGGFAEAERGYAQKDMDHPKDVRYRYNRGCAAFKNSDLQTAAAAFSSVLRRTKDDEVRFRAAYNLGNISFDQKDLQTAIEYFKQAVLLNPDSNDARYNLELALREWQKLQKTEKPEGERQQGNEQQKDKKGQSENYKDQDRQSGDKSSDKERTGDQDKKADKNDKHDEPRQGEALDRERERRSKDNSPEDLSGELKGSREMPEQREKGKQEGASEAVIDKKKAEALLDNINEDRSRFLRFQIPEEKRRGVASSKNW